ncbi:MAG: hypothetical protein M1840_005205 [Geoglossum simile]|nr:MAG: hypothetical protein M1840_005205 [Geoglossum simile]
MSLASRHILSDEESVRSLRRDTDNIFNWGLGGRLAEARGILKLVDRTLGDSDAGEDNTKREKAVKVTDAGRAERVKKRKLSP